MDNRETDNASAPKAKSQRKIGVLLQNDSAVSQVLESSDSVVKKAGERTPPPPYSEKGDNSSVHSPVSARRISNCTVASESSKLEIESGAYQVPKDLSEGLPNPVFTHTANPDDVDDPDASSKGNATATFESLGKSNCNGHHHHRYSHSEYDAEKGPPPPLSSKDSNGNATSNSKVVKQKKGANDKEYKGIKRYLGLLLTLSASFFFSMVVLFVKVLKDYGFDAYGASFWRYTGTVIPTIPLLLFYECGPGKTKQASVFTSVWPLTKNENWKTWIGLVSRGLIGSTSVILRYYALQYLTIGDTSVITYSTPVLVTVLAHFFLGERCGVFPVIVAFVTLCGVVIVTKPPILTGATEFDSNTLIGTGLACGSLFCSALIVIITRKIREVHFTVMTLVFGIIGVAQALVLINFFGHFNLPTEAFDSVLVAGVSSLSFLGQMSIVLALKFEQAGPVALIRSCDVLFGFLLQYIFLHVVPDIFSIVGAVIVLTGVLSIGLRKWLNTLPEDDVQRKRWWFILT